MVRELHRMDRPDLDAEPLHRKDRGGIAHMAVGHVGLYRQNVHRSCPKSRIRVSASPGPQQIALFDPSHHRCIRDRGRSAWLPCDLDDPGAIHEPRDPSRTSVVDFVRANREFAPIVLALLTFGEFAGLRVAGHPGGHDPDRGRLCRRGRRHPVLAGLAGGRLRRRPRAGGSPLPSGAATRRAAYGFWPLSANPTPDRAR